MTNSLTTYSDAIDDTLRRLREAQGQCADSGDTFLAEELGDLIETIEQTAIDVKRFHARQNALKPAAALKWGAR